MKSSLIRSTAVASLIALLLCANAFAQAPSITCPGTVDLTLDDIGAYCIEVPITGADSVTTSSGTWQNDTLCVTISMPVSDTFTITAFTIAGDTSTCDVAIDFPGVTTKSGSIVGQTWTASNQPYAVVGDIQVASLTIEAGVEIRFYGDFVFDASGVLTAVGTKEAPITFTAGIDTMSWQGILFQNGVPGSALSYCHISKADNSGIRIIDSYPEITNCDVIDNFSPNNGGGIYISNTGSGELLISRTSISNNSTSTYYPSPKSNGAGVWVSAQTGKVTFEDCDISFNQLYTTEGWVYGGGCRVSGNVTFLGCRINGNRSDGRDNIPGGSSAGNGGGIMIDDGSIEISNCIIEDNYAYGRASGGLSGNSGYAYGGAIFVSAGDVSIVNSIIAADTAASSHGTHAGGIYNNLGNISIENSTLLETNDMVIENVNGSVDVLNSIIYFITGGATQISPTTTIRFSDVQDGYTGEGNINFNPLLDSTYHILLGSPCIDAGDSLTQYDDVCFPPSLGGVRNDMGAHGGPGACNWPHDVVIDCPGELVVSLCSLQDSVCIPLSVGNDTIVDVTSSNGVWSNNQLCFATPDWGIYSFGITAENSSSADTCEFTVLLRQSQPLQLGAHRVLFASTDSGPNPASKTIAIDAPCDSGAVNWQATVYGGGNWLTIDKSSGTNPDSLQFSVDKTGLPPGIYGAVVKIENTLTADPAQVVSVTLFIIDGTDVGTVITKPGQVVGVPITINTDNQNPNDSVIAFTIPIEYLSSQLDKVTVDSVIFDDPGVIKYFDSINVILDPLNGTFIVDRPIDDPPLPDSVYTCQAWFTIDSSAADEAVAIDTATIDVNATTYSYQFVQTGSVVTVPDFSPGAIVIGNPGPPVIMLNIDSLQFHATPPFDTCLYYPVTNADSVVVSVRSGSVSNVSWDNDTLCFTIDAEGIFEIEVSAYNMFDSTAQRVTVGTTDVLLDKTDNLPSRYELGQNYPNPFNPKTTIKFALPRATHVEIEIYNIVGQRVTTLVDRDLTAGYYNVEWDSTDRTGRAVASGIYFYRIRTDAFVESKKMLLLK